jgi:N,N-dimethylformamidase
MTPLAGYAEKLSVRPGEIIRFHVSSNVDGPVDAHVVRVICADANPAGPGIQLEPVALRPVQVGMPSPQSVPRGSFAIVENAGEVLAKLTSFSIRATVWIGGKGMPGCILSMGGRGDVASGVVLSTTSKADYIAFQALLGQGVEAPVVLTSLEVEPERWYHVALSFDADRRVVELAVAPTDGLSPPRVVTQTARVPVVFAASSGIRIGGGHGMPAGGPLSSFNGRIEKPTIFKSALNLADLDQMSPTRIESEIVGSWDFAKEIQTAQIIDVSPNRLHGVLVNCPTRGVTGHNWTGEEMQWSRAPHHYGAIHFHDDDIEDCKWPVTFEWHVPQGLRSANYALMLTSGDAADNIPFFVVPAKGRPTAKLAVLVSTFTYTVYANHLRPEWQSDPVWVAAWRAQTAAWGAYPHHPGDNAEFGLSTYNYHADGSGISIASWHRPMLNIRVGYITYPYPDIRGSGARHYQPDTHLTAWLEAKGIAYDIITDWELHTEGHDLLKDYAVLLTGTHPEYHTREMLDALTSYRDQGGRFCYLGGNGFYWKIALSPDKAGIVEIRRGEGGIRAWAADPGEYYNQFDGQYGGLWRRNGRPPQKLAGVGFTAQGNFVGSYYRVLPEAKDARVDWMFKGIDEALIGDFGLSGHGAAGFELDRTDKKLGTPRHALVVARSENHPADAPWVLVPEEQLTHLVTVAGRPAKELIRADMTFFETPNGGAVFSTGSITFCGSLPQTGFDNNISTLLGNVVGRFLDPKPFSMPS